MLSSAATSLTLLGRHLERADHLARILGVHVALSLDRDDEPGPEFWVRFMELAGWRGSDTGRRDQVVEMVITGTLGPSVRTSVAAARLAAQAVRPSLPRELYEHVNAVLVGHDLGEEAVAAVQAALAEGVPEDRLRGAAGRLARVSAWAASG